MENPDCDKSSAGCDDPNLNRSRSFKSKQLVRSQAIRESQSPPRTISPAVASSNDVTTDNVINDNVTNDNVRTDNVTDNETNSTRTLEISSHSSNGLNVCDVKLNDNLNGDVKKLPVEIQITQGAWDADSSSEQRQRAKRWLGNRNKSDSSRDLLSNNPRVACVCGYCAACPHCRGRRRRHPCATKQDSGVVCSDECPDCCTTPTGGNDDNRKSSSLDVEDQTNYCRCPERKDKPKNISLSSTEPDGTFEPTCVDVVRFLQDTLNKNSKDRFMLLRIEKELHSLVNDTGRCIVRFPVMSSYHRLLVHRCASLFQLSHHLDQNSKTCVLVSKSGTSGGRIPCTSFKEWCTMTFPPSPQRLQPDATNAKSILKRATHSLEEGGVEALSAGRSKSLEQRERDYERVRRRIFSTDNCTQDESQWPWLASGPVKVLAPEGGRNKLLKVHSLEGNGGRSRGAVSKSHSFGGYSADPPQHPPRLLSRQGDLASSSWRLSPSSSGYKTLSLRSTDSVTPSPTGGASPEPGVGVGVGVESSAVVWAVTDMSAVPAGALVIHPQTGRPLTNADGSVYHFDPANPPILYDSSAFLQNEKTEQSCDLKRRGRLEKQHSFIDNECECQPQEECRTKCCCEYRRQAGSVADKETNKTPSPKTYEESNHETIHGAYETNNQSAEVTPYDTNYGTQARAFEQAQGNEQNIQDVQETYPQYVQEMCTEEQALAPHVAATATVAGTVAATHPVPHTLHVTHPYDNIAHNMPIRPVSLTNVMYPTQVHQYPYYNQNRMEAPLQVYQQVIPHHEEQKPLQPASHHNDNTFRIDPNYPYPGVEYACGTCVDTSLQHAQRSYIPYGVPAPAPVEAGVSAAGSTGVSAAVSAGAGATVLPSYPVGNFIMPQIHPYQDQVQWANMQPQVGVGVGMGMPPPKLYLPEVYPVVQYPQPYHQYNVLYPQVFPQHIVNPVYPVIDKPDTRRNSFTYNRQSKRNSATNSARNTPQTPETYERNYEANKDRPNEIALKIQQIKDQMAQMNVGDRDNRYRRTEDFRRRNSGNGILGSYPVNNVNRNANNENHLSSAARAIVTSIRNMQNRNTYHHDNRRNIDNNPRFDNYHRQDIPDRYRPRQENRDVTHPHNDRGRRFNVPMQYRPPFMLSYRQAFGAGLHPDQYIQ